MKKRCSGDMTNLLPEFRLKCKKCRHIWMPRIENPIKCPRCGSIIKDPVIVRAKKDET
jgi:predicted Zn-ribbon and HTH transcriptional regulator